MTVNNNVQVCYTVGIWQVFNARSLGLRYHNHGVIRDRCDDDDDDVMTAADAANVCLHGRWCCLARSVLYFDRDNETRQQPGRLLAATSTPDELWRHHRLYTLLPLTTASVVKTTLMADDAQAQKASFRSSFVQRLVDGGRRQEKFQRLSASNSGRHLSQWVPVDGFVGHSVDGDTGKAPSSTYAAGRCERLTSNVDSNTGANHCHCGFFDNALQVKPKLTRLMSSVTGHCITTTNTRNLLLLTSSRKLAPFPIPSLHLMPSLVENVPEFPYDQKTDKKDYRRNQKRSPKVR